MAVFKHGILSGVSGRVGNTIYYMLNGKQVSRMAGRIAKPPTKKQLANRQAMKVIVNFLRPIGLFVQTGFGLEAQRGGLLSQHAAVSYNKSNALKGAYPQIEVDFAKVLVSTGALRQLDNPSAVLLGNEEEGYSLWFSWDVPADEKEWPRCNDRVMLLVYFPEVELTDDEGNLIGRLDAETCMEMCGAKRKDGQDVLELSSALTERSMEVYIAVIAEDRKAIADSQYLGRLTKNT